MPTAIIQAVELLLGFNRAKLRPPTPNRDPLRLVRVLRSCGFPLSPALEQTAVLHGMLDNIEDPAKLQQALAAIRRVCGEDVASMVRSLAKDPAHKAYPPHIAEQRYLARLGCHAMRHPEILLVKLGEYLYEIDLHSRSKIEKASKIAKLTKSFLNLCDSNPKIASEKCYQILRKSLQFHNYSSIQTLSLYRHVK